MNNRQSMYGSIAVAISIAGVIVSGCSAKSDAPTMVAVSGTLSIDGKPQENISVTFIPDNSKGTQGPASVGRTNADGKFTLTGPGNRTGAMIGFHKVTVASGWWIERNRCRKRWSRAVQAPSIACRS